MPEIFLVNILAAGGVPTGEVTEGGNIFVLFIIFIFAIGVSAVCSVWEAVLLSITTPYIRNLKKDKPKIYEKLNKLKSQVDRPLISILTLNTVAHTVGAILFGIHLARVINDFVAGNKELAGTLNSLGAIFMTIAILILSEIIPKNYGARHWKKLAPWVGNCLYALSWVMTPVIWVIGLMSRGGHHEDTISREELAVMAEMGKLQGHIDEGESRVVENVLAFKDKVVKEIMTPRVVMFSLPADLNIRDYLKNYVRDNPFSRIPIYEGDDKEDIIGFVLKDEILIKAAEDKFETTLLDLRKDVAMISELTSFPEAFESLQSNQFQLAVVHDEYGGVTGIVSIEDFTEELWGIEIVDEADTADDMQEVARKKWEEKSKRTGIKLIKKDKLPEEGEKGST